MKSKDQISKDKLTKKMEKEAAAAEKKEKIEYLTAAGYDIKNWPIAAIEATFKALTEVKTIKKARAAKGEAKAKAQPKTVWDRAIATVDSDKILDSKCKSRIMRAFNLEDKDWVLDGQEVSEDLRVIGNLHSLGFLTKEAVAVFQGFMAYTPARIEKDAKADIIAAAKAAKSNGK